jgi:bifunctional DNase/RNase
VNDSVAVDAKRILLRYGAPIAILDEVTEAHRIEFAREIAKTALPEREARLRELLIAEGYIQVEQD